MGSTNFRRGVMLAAAGKKCMQRAQPIGPVATRECMLYVIPPKVSGALQASWRLEPACELRAAKKESALDHALAKINRSFEFHPLKYSIAIEVDTAESGESME